MKQSSITLERLKQTVGSKGGCTPLFLKVLKSDLHRLISQYMRFEQMEISVRPVEEDYALTISLKVKEFFDLGRNE